ncbi:GspMb/PilO family protein [Pseudoduganella lutea]|nr:GspMb/PilO family protein [Pseudoduganella lutea]
MNERLRAALAAMPARQLNLLCIGVVAIAAMLAWSAGLRAPLAAWRQQRAAVTALQASNAATATMRAANAPLAAAGRPAPTPMMQTTPTPLALIGAVSGSAKRAGVDVSSASQGAEQAAAGLRQQTVDITATGTYTAIHLWLDDIERTQPAVGIVQLDMQPGEAGAQREVTLQLAIYGLPITP